MPASKRKPTARKDAKMCVAWLVADLWGPVGAFKHRSDALKRAAEASHRWPSAAPCKVMRILYRQPSPSRPKRVKP